MGCCDSKDGPGAFKEPKGKVRKMTKYVDMSVMQNQDLMVIPGSHLIDPGIDSDTKAVRFYVEWCKHNKKWKELSIFIWDNTPIEEFSVVNLFSQPPNTLASLVLIFLYQGLEESFEEIRRISESVMPDLIKLTAISDLDFLTNFLLLAQKILEEANEKLVKLVLNFGFFENTKKFISLKNQSVLKLLLSVSMMVYSNKKYAQDRYCNSESDSRLIKLLTALSDQHPEISEQVLECLSALIVLPNDKFNNYAKSRLNGYSLLQILQSSPHLSDYPAYSFLASKLSHCPTYPSYSSIASSLSPLHALT